MADSISRGMSEETAGKRGQIALFFYNILDFLTENVYDNNRAVSRICFEEYERLKKLNKIIKRGNSMKALKKLAGLILAVCLMVPMLGTVVFAADGVLMFSDPSTKVGENVGVDFVVQSSGGTVGSVNVTMSYDASVLEFVSGDGFSADGSGTLTYTGTGSGSELRTTVTFRALQATDTTITVSSSTASLSSGETLNLELGSSAISIAAADDGTTSVEPTTTAQTTDTGSDTGITVTVNGTDYRFSEAFTTTDIPEGYSETTMTFNGGERKFVVNDAGIYLGYLTDGSGTGNFFLFNSEDATFAPFAQLTISDTTSIIPLDKPEEVNLPDNYQESELTVQDQVFPIWSDPSVSDRYYLIYALNTRTGQESLYQYDSEDGTYQYFEAPEPVEEEETQAALPGTVGAFISEHILPILVAAVAVCLLLLILMIIFAVKLVHRNQELDDLYDEYDIPYDDEEEDTKNKSGKKASAKTKEADDEYDDLEYGDDDFDDEYDDEADDDDYDDEYGYDEDDLDVEYDEEDDLDDEEDDLDTGHETSGNSRGGRNRKKEDTSDDDYDINFIDL